MRSKKDKYQCVEFSEFVRIDFRKFWELKGDINRMKPHTFC